jgi:hypothetical protein
MRNTLLTVICLCGCNSPSPWLAGGTNQQVVLDGVTISVWQKGDQAEAIRMGHAPRRDQPRLRPLMVRAIEQVTGCTLRPGTLDGDTGVLRAAVDCRASAALAPDQ